MKKLILPVVSIFGMAVVASQLYAANTKALSATIMLTKPQATMEPTASPEPIISPEPTSEPVTNSPSEPQTEAVPEGVDIAQDEPQVQVPTPTPTPVSSKPSGPTGPGGTWPVNLN